MSNYFIYDLFIIGAGPAGLSASVYASRYGLKHAIAGGVGGGLASEAHEIGNWLGTQKISGFQFAQNAMEHARSYGVDFFQILADRMEREEEHFKIFLADGKKTRARTILLANGTKHRRLGVPGEKEKAGKGVSYCATCDGFFYRGKIVAVVGGSNSAAGAAVYLGNIAEKVYLIYRRDKLRAENFWMTAIESNPKIKTVYNANVKEIKGFDKVEEIILDNPCEGSVSLKIDGIFIEIGLDPNTEMAKNLNIELDEEGYVAIDSECRTTEKGIWAAGDITTGSNKLKQIITAAAEGAIAAESIQRHLKK